MTLPFVLLEGDFIRPFAGGEAPPLYPRPSPTSAAGAGAGRQAWRFASNPGLLLLLNKMADARV
jgi:hypothetical protein